MAQTIQLRRGTAAAWTLADPVLAQGEVGLETDTLLYKIGNGTDAWTALSYATLQPEFEVTTFTAQGSAPSTPSAGDMHFYAMSTAGRILPRIKGPSGLDTALQPSFFGNGLMSVRPNAAATFTTIGIGSPTVVGTASTPALNATDLRQSTRRTNVVSAAGANSAAELRHAVSHAWRGDAANRGGWFMRQRFAISSDPATVLLQRAFHGLYSATSAIATTQSPAALLNCIGMMYESSETNWRIGHNDGSGACTRIDLGANFPTSLGVIYDLSLFAAPNGSEIGWQVERVETGDVASGTITTDMPISTQFLSWHAYMNNGGTALACGFDLILWYFETDF